MDEHDRLASLEAETLALQTLFVGLCNAITSREGSLGAAVGEAFDYAEDILHLGASKIGGETPKAHFQQTLRIVQQFRAGVQGHSEPKHHI